MFFNKKNKIIFSCTENNYGLYKALPPNYASTFYPEWFKNLKPSLFNEKHSVTYESSTVKNCPGIKMLLSNGFIIPMWTDLIIDINPDGTYKWLFSSHGAFADTHQKAQFGAFGINHGHIKLHSPWIAETFKSKKFLITSPYYHVDGFSDFNIMPGIADFYYTNSTNVFILFKIKSDPYRIYIPAGFPLIHLISTDNDNFLKIETKMITQNQFDGKFNINKVSFLKSYEHYVRWIKQKSV